MEISFKLQLESRWSANSNWWLAQGSENVNCSAGLLLSSLLQKCQIFDKGPFLPLSIHTFGNHKASKQMHKWNDEESLWGLRDINKILNLYWFTAFPSLYCLLTCHSFPQKGASYFSPGRNMDPCWNTGLPACEALTWDTAIGWWGALQPSLSCTAGANPPDLPSAAPISIPPLAPCSEGKYYHLYTPHPLQKALVTWASGTGG